MFTTSNNGWKIILDAKMNTKSLIDSENMNYHCLPKSSLTILISPVDDGLVSNAE